MPDPMPFALTLGDPAGIGPELICKLAVDPARLSVPLLVIGDVGILRRAAGIVAPTLQIVPVADPAEALGVPPGALAVLPLVEALPPDLPFGKIDARAGAAVYASLCTAIDLAMEKRIAAIVTPPLHKEALKAAGVSLPGHTEILAARSGTDHVAMMLANDELRVLLVSIHLSLSDAIKAVTVENECRAIRFAHQACRAYGIDAPRVAVAGLNPHAGEGGLFGREDLDVIMPAIARMRAEGIDASGPWPGDTIFMRARQGEFDIVVAQYHDQGLIPVKYLGIDHGVNITVGLPFVRTSVDHGTAFDIAGTGKADATSLRTALAQAVAMTRGI
jgi:4-hydroxythreonine-4-phosphate dehydrogenase